MSQLNQEIIANTNLSLSRLFSTPSLSSLDNFKTANGRNKLAHQPSKLDLIDDTQLTSLPLPPPLKLRGRNSTQSLLNNERTNSPVFSSRSSSSSVADVQEEHEEGEQNEEDEDDDDDYEGEQDDPIVLIEDYITHQSDEILPETSSIQSSDSVDHLINKKKSLATFKQRMLKNSLAQEDIASISDISTITSSHNFDDTIVKEDSTMMNSMASISSLHKPTNKRSISNDIVPNDGDCSQKRRENLEEIFGKIPGTDLLKYCDLCEKPLYEISSIINNNKKFKKMAKVNDAYTEFICGECVEMYEEFFNELYQNELDASAEKAIRDNSKNVKLLAIFQLIGQKYEEPKLAPKRSFFGKAPTKILANKTSFSETLMGTLTYLNNIPEGSSYNSKRFGFGLLPKKSIDIEWIKNLQFKLRWNWGANSEV